MKVQVFISSCCEVVLKASSVASTYKASRGLHALARTARVSCLWRPAGSVRVQACAAVGTDNSASLFFDAGTGRVASADGQRCLTAQQRTGPEPSLMIMTACVALPSDGQQFQFHDTLGILRPKSSGCIAAWGGALMQYRDCCVAVCN
eukprot:m.964176 g.964176  ORF g.964176 m.964176 type:complete len:148 (+) comp23902_c0_seq7:95-538(+)